jgi:hypothetical protein
VNLAAKLLRWADSLHKLPQGDPARQQGQAFSRPVERGVYRDSLREHQAVPAAKSPVQTFACLFSRVKVVFIYLLHATARCRSCTSRYFTDGFHILAWQHRPRIKSFKPTPRWQTCHSTFINDPNSDPHHGSTCATTCPDCTKRAGTGTAAQPLRRLVDDSHTARLRLLGMQAAGQMRNCLQTARTKASPLSRVSVTRHVLATMTRRQRRPVIL